MDCNINIFCKLDGHGTRGVTVFIFQMCGRIIAPLKMHHRIKHMRQMFDEEGRIQLYEFLDLILWTELYNTHRPPDPTADKDPKGKPASLYQVL